MKDVNYNKNNHNGYLNKGVALFKLKNYGEAIKAYEIAINLKPNYFLAWYHKGLTLSELIR